MHDANGHVLTVGDKVVIPCEIIELQGCEDYCNVVVRSTLGRRPDGDREAIYAINTGVLVKVSSRNVHLNL